jgi:ABC-type multidrug transport system fused ATPase/permease subunit
MTIVPLIPVISSMNVRENVRFGYPDASRGEMAAIEPLENADTYIWQLKEGYNTHPQQNMLSGGQQELVCIGRAV